MNYDNFFANHDYTPPPFNSVILQRLVFFFNYLNSINSLGVLKVIYFIHINRKNKQLNILELD